MNKLIALLLATVALGSPVAWAKPTTVSLSVPGMTCAACPITVKKALANVAGVSKAAVSFEKRDAVVTFEDTRTDPDALRKATAAAGYPSTLKN